MIKILLVEDDLGLSNSVFDFLDDFADVMQVFDGEEGLYEAESGVYDLILLDLMLPEKNGFQVLKELREKGISTPVLIMTAKESLDDKGHGFELGADDYVAKPYRLKELLSRISANLRRYDMSGKGVCDVYTFGNHRFAISEFRLYEGDKLIDCTQNELRLLKELVANEGIVLSRSTLLDRLYDVDGVLIDDNTLSVYMKRLRTKLRDDASCIETVRGVGYRFCRNSGDNNRG